jgi:hypothetical protein
VTRDGQHWVQYHYDDELVVTRFGNRTVVRTKLASLESVAGAVREFRSEVWTGPGPVITEGRYQDGQLVIETTTDGKKRSDRIPWDPAWGGFFADRQSLRRAPMKPREQRRLRALMPIVHQVAEIRLDAVGYEATQLLSESRQLLRIDVTNDLGKVQLKSILWTDETGKPWKTRDLQLGLEACLTTPDVARGRPADVGLDLGRQTIVKVNQSLSEPHHTKRGVYRARLQDGDVHTLFVAGNTQRLRRVDDRTAEITVISVRPGEVNEAAGNSEQTTVADVASSPLIQSDDAGVVAMAQGVAPDEADPWKLACALERHVKQTIQLKNYTTALATAAEVVKSREGDCTEHAMLLAALCRARKIPARVAVGLVYYTPERGFAFHMWNEAWIGETWIPLDATLGQGGIGAAHLKVAATNLSGVSAFTDLLPVVQAIGKLELEVVSFE